MDFEPAISAPASPTKLAWSFVFAEGHLLLPGDEDAPTPAASPDAPTRHYLGRLGGLDAWAFELDAIGLLVPPPPAGAACRCARR